MCPEGEEGEEVQRQAIIEAETDSDGDAVSNYASDVSETTSTTSSVRKFVYENGRRYHSYRPGQYLLPNDETEQERLDIIHHVFSLTLDGALCKTKLEKPQSILDLGTGTGIWAIDMGDAYPSAEIIGTDLSPIQPEWVPPNVIFQVDDATLEWTFPEDKFDLIHARTLAGAIQDWPALIHECYTHCKPGGFVEISEGRANFFCDDDSLSKDSKTWEWLSEFRRLSGPLGFDIAPKLPEMLKVEGFENVEFVQKHVPLGTWPKDPKLKEIGKFFRVQFLERAIEAYSLALFTRFGSWTSEEVQVLLALVREELKSNKIHLYTFSAFATGRKPIVEPEES
ncbi:S-adenosyl-L-methionine-dependent methyltransferase [Thelonectria olida]|uniref:S-adenosyl-L-methionine-dependent methyltransferase n=1 Tax=Thelonectria olida TaxID=1576542 RepID=A0A9P8W9E5_9HYPO|nr:S-adenosyl-L-methionine-dependent methyltransferase [Thelonectria olida]